MSANAQTELKKRTVIFYALQIQCLQEDAILVMKTARQDIKQAS